MIVKIINKINNLCDEFYEKLYISGIKYTCILKLNMENLKLLN